MLRVLEDYRRSLLVLLVAASLPGVAVVASGGTDGPPDLTGSLETRDGVRILRLWGSPRERGFAHGYLMAREIYTTFTKGLEPKYPSAAVYETMVLRGYLRLMDFEDGYMQELRGMHEGMLARLGAEAMRSEWLARALSVEDLMVYNCYADFHGLFCSSFTVWGELSAHGVFTARNLDYPIEPEHRQGQILVVHLNKDNGRKSFISLLWPGQIGVTTAMNEDGVTLALHDSNRLPPDPTLKYKPRLVQMRAAIESAAGKTAFQDVADALSTGPSMLGNNVLMSRPARFGAEPAVVIEYDGRPPGSEPLTVRSARDNPPDVPSQALICTNHYCARQEPRDCHRFSTMRTALEEKRKSNSAVRVEDARRIMSDVARREGRLFTLHTVYFFPDTSELEFSLCTADTPSTDTRAHRFTLAELLSAE